MHIPLSIYRCGYIRYCRRACQKSWEFELFQFLKIFFSDARAIMIWIMTKRNRSALEYFHQKIKNSINQSYKFPSSIWIYEYPLIFSTPCCSNHHVHFLLIYSLLTCYLTCSSYYLLPSNYQGLFTFCSKLSLSFILLLHMSTNTAILSKW